VTDTTKGRGGRPSDQEEAENDRQRSELFGLFALALLLSIIYFGYREQPTEMGIAIAGCVLAMILAELENFAEFSGLGIRAKLRKTEKKALKAYARAEQVQATVHALGVITTTLMARFTLWGVDMPIAEKMRMWTKLRTELQQIGLRAEAIEEMAKPVRHAVRHAHATRIESAVQKDGREVPVEVRERLYNFKREFVADAATFRRVLTEHLYPADTWEQLVDDLDHFERTETLKRPEEWETKHA
jgi:hypothetical protein